MMRSVGNYISDILSLMFILCLVFVPLGLWKLVEIIIWLVRHLSISYVA